MGLGKLQLHPWRLTRSWRVNTVIPFQVIDYMYTENSPHSKSYNSYMPNFSFSINSCCCDTPYRATFTIATKMSHSNGVDQLNIKTFQQLMLTGRCIPNRWLVDRLFSIKVGSLTTAGPRDSYIQSHNFKRISKRQWVNLFPLLLQASI